MDNLTFQTGKGYYMKLTNFILAILLTLLPASMEAYAATPTETVKAHVDNVMTVLSSTGDDELKKKGIRDIAAIMFDFSSMAKATLGKNWKQLTAGERTEFIRLLRAMLENAYISKLLGYSDEKAEFLKERALSSTRVEVQSRLITKSAEIPMHYRMLMTKNKEWKVYDIIIEGVSLIKNYRTQFRQVLAKQSPQELLDIMKKKAGEI